MRRVVLLVLGCLMATILGTACTPAASPAQPPAKSTNAPASTTSPSTAPKAPDTTKSPASSDWQAEWEKTVAAANKEGTVVVASGPGDSYRTAAMAFEKSYPSIRVEATGLRGPDFSTRIAAERAGGKYLWDIWIGGWDTALENKAKGVLSPVRPALIRPEVLDSKWLDGFENSWVDNDRQYMFQFASRLQVLAYVNRDVVPESELSTADQLLDPKWKGKISSMDPRIGGNANSYLAYLVSVKGEEWVRNLLAQGIVISTDGRQQAESLVRGAVPIALAPTSDIEEFRKQGLGKNVKPLDAQSPAGARLVAGFGNLMLIDKAPHSNAAKVFANWLLSKEGQKAYVEATTLNSANLDVPGPAESAPDPKAKYEIREKEAFVPKLNSARARDIAKEIIK